VPRPLHENPKVVAKAKDLWRRHMEQTSIDADGRHNVYGLQGLLTRTCDESGETLVRRRRRRPSDGLPLPFQLELLEPDHLDESRDNWRTPSGGRVQAGIELDAISQRTGYWIWPQHPGEMFGQLEPSRFVPASEILHVYESKRPKQLRGVPRLAPVIIRARGLSEYEDASLLKQQISACLTLIVQDPASDPDPVPPGVTREKVVQELEPGARIDLGPGQTAAFSDPPASDNYADYVTANLRAIAAAAGVTYEALSGDWRNVNYSSARMGAQTSQQSIERFRWLVLVPQFLDPLWGWFVEAAQLAGELPMGEIGVRWTPPRRLILNPKEEVPGMRDQARAGLASISDLIRQDGQDPEEVWTELAADIKRLNALGLKVECDPAVPMRGGPAAPGDGAPPA
jgi:lambda family phage portal protein